MATREWTVLPDVPTARSGVERFDPDTGSWQEVTPLVTARHGLGAAALADGIVAVGGGPDAGRSHSVGTEIWRP